MGKTGFRIGGKKRAGGPDEERISLMAMRRKSDLPQKICVTCGRPFTWRKKWEKVWQEVRYCSKKCSSARRSATKV